MRQFLFIFLLILSDGVSAQKEKTFKIQDIIIVKESTLAKAHQYLKDRHFSFIGKLEECNSYAQAYNAETQGAPLWCYKYFDGKLKIVEGNEGKHIAYLKQELKNYEKNIDFSEDGWVLTKYAYKSYSIRIRENDKISKYELYLE